MFQWLIYGMIYLGSALMVYNIYGFVRFAADIRSRESKKTDVRVLYVPVALLVLFLLGYLAVGLFGKPDLIVAGILFGGSIFVFVMYRLLSRITKRIIENSKLAAELAAAESSSRTSSRLLASISHEMRTPMNVILGLDDLALKRPDLPSDTREQLEKIGISGRQLLRLINNVLDIQSYESGELTARQLRFSLAAMLEEICGVLSSQCKEKGLTWRMTAPEEPMGSYLGDELLIKQVMMNLLFNAVKFTDAPGTVSLTVCRMSRGEKVDLRFTVEDTGIGMSEEFLARIYRPFSKEDDTAMTAHGGSGLGLTNARNKVEVMGGFISVTSRKGSGTTFTVTIPVLPCAEETVPEASPSEPVELEGRRILIVEDIEENAEIVADLLDLEGALSDHAENGQVAVDMFRSAEPGTYDAILMDLRMPVMDGLEATRQIRAMDRPDAASVPIIALTANAFDSDVRQSLDAGMNAHLAKPSDAETLYAALKHWIRSDKEEKVKKP